MRSMTSRSTKLRSVFSTIGFAAAALAWSCSSTGAHGTLVVDWTVNGTKDVALCDQNIGWVVVELRDAGGNVTANHGPCHAFTTEFGGAIAGPYTLSAYMLNAGDDTMLSTVAPIRVDVNEDLTSTIAIDFPITVTP